MAIYKDVEPLEIVTYQGESEDFDRGVKFILEKIDALPVADVVEVDTLKDWLWELARNNGGIFSEVCVDLISRLDGLRNFAKERSEGDG